jgi:peptidyl-prolyl cis-trans isomerase D
MLQVLREKASSWVIKILLGLLIVAFAIWGINDVFLGERDPAVAEVGGTKILRSEFEESYRQELDRLRQAIGNIDRETAQRMGIDRQVLSRLVNSAAIKIAARDLGVVVSDPMINMYIRSDPRFKDSKGTFDRRRFTQSLRAANIGEAYYVQNLKQALSTDLLTQTISGHIPVPKALADPMVRFRSEERVAKTVLVPPPPLGKAPEPKDEDVSKYYKENTARFTAPEYREVTYIYLDPKAMAKDIVVSEDSIKADYEARKSTEFMVPDRRKIQQVVFPPEAEAAAKAASADIKKGKSLADAAKEHGKTLKVVNLDWVEKRDLLTEIADPVFAVKKGQVSAPLKSSLGWHLVQVEDIQKGRTIPLKEASNKIRESIALTQAQNDVNKLTPTLDDALAGGADLNEAAAKINLKAQRIPALDSQGRGRDGKKVADLPVGGNFIRTAFDTQEGQTSSLVDTHNGGYYVLTVNKITPPAPRPLTEVRSVAVMSWKAEQQAQTAEKRAKSILDRIKKGATIEAVAKEEKLEVSNSKPFTRLTHEAQSGVPAALAEQMFGFKTGEAGMAESPKGFVVGVLVSANPAGGEDKTKIEELTKNEITDGIASDLTDELIQAFRKRYTIKTYPDRLQPRQ